MVKKSADAVGLDPELLSKSPFELSGGQKRRAAIAGVLAMKPEVLVLDEPAAGLDPKAKNSILSMLKKLNREMGITIVIISHSMEDIAEFCDRMIVLNRGTVKFSGTPKEIFKNRKELEGIGLSVPQAASFVQRLHNRGAEVDESSCTVSEVLDTVEEYLSKFKGFEK